MNGARSLFMGTAFFAAVLLLFVLLKLKIGPTPSDRVLAFDVFNTLTSLILLLLAAACDSGVVLDVALVHIVVSFVMTLCCARCIGGKAE